MAAFFLRKNDQVVVITGKDKGKIGRIMAVYPEKNRVLIEKVNLVKRHTKPNMKNRQGGIVEKEASVHASNVMLLDPKTSKGTRVRNQTDKGGKKVRIAVKSQHVFEQK